MWENLTLLSWKFWWDFKNLISYMGNTSPWELLTQEFLSMKHCALTTNCSKLHFPGTQNMNEYALYHAKYLVLCTYIPASRKTCVMKKLVTKSCGSTLKLKMFFLIIMYIVPATGMSFYWWWWTVITWNSEMKEVTGKNLVCTWQRTLVNEI